MSASRTSSSVDLNELTRWVGELAYESYRVGKQKRQIVDNHLAHGGVKCGEQFVLGEHIAFAQQIHEGGLAYVGISYEGHSGKFAAILRCIDFCESILASSA